MTVLTWLWRYKLRFSFERLLKCIVNRLIGFFIKIGCHVYEVWRCEDFTTMTYCSELCPSIEGSNDKLLLAMASWWVWIGKNFGSTGDRYDPRSALNCTWVGIKASIVCCFQWRYTSVMAGSAGHLVELVIAGDYDQHFSFICVHTYYKLTELPSLQH